MGPFDQHEGGSLLTHFLADPLAAAARLSGRPPPPPALGARGDSPAPVRELL
eukprot:gene13013-58748_t